MKLRHAIAIATLAGIASASAQNTVPEADGDSLIEAAAKILNPKPEKPNEVSVVLPPPDSEPATTAEAAEDDADPAEETPPDAGEDSSEQGEQAPEDDETQAEEAPAETPTEAPAEAPEEAPQEPEPGLAVRVERVQSGSGEIDPAQVKLLAPFPAKLLARTPAGWRIEASEQAPPFTREVELSPGKNISLTIRPHLLVAEADGIGVFEVAEPGFDAPLGYHQHSTVGAILSNSIRQLENDSKQLSGAIEQLQQLLISLPQPEPEPTPEAAVDPQTEKNRKR